MTKITDEMLSAGCLAYAVHSNKTREDAMRAALEVVAPLIEAQTIERCAQVADYQAELCKAAQDSDEPNEIDKYGISVAEDIATDLRTLSKAPSNDQS